MSRPLHRYGLFFILFIQVFAACSGDELKDVKAIPAKTLILNKDRSLGVELVYSDSAVVKAKGYAPVMDKVTEKTGYTYQEMPEGVKIDFYELSKLKGSITSDYAIRRELEKLTIFKRNVVVTYPQGKYTSEELTWNENKKVYTSPEGIYTKADGSALRATNFEATQDFKKVTMAYASADIYTKSKL